MTDTNFQTAERLRETSGNKLDTAARSGEKRTSDTFSTVAGEKIAESWSGAKEAGSSVAEGLQEQLKVRQSAGLDYAIHFVKNMRTAASSFEHDTPIVARLVENAADYVEQTAGKLRSGSPNDLVGSVKSFARRQPMAFCGLSLLAGFAAIRFLKASQGSSEPPLASATQKPRDYSRPSESANAEF